MTSGRSVDASAECKSVNFRRIPPYALYAFVGSVVAFVVSAALGYAVLGGVLFLIAGFPMLWLTRRSGHYRCISCGRVWLDK